MIPTPELCYLDDFCQILGIWKPIGIGNPFVSRGGTVLLWSRVCDGSTVSLFCRGLGKVYVVSSTLHRTMCTVKRTCLVTTVTIGSNSQNDNTVRDSALHAAGVTKKLLGLDQNIFNLPPSPPTVVQIYGHLSKPGPHSSFSKAKKYFQNVSLSTSRNKDSNMSEINPNNLPNKNIPNCRYRIVSCLSFIAHQSLPPETTLKSMHEVAVERYTASLFPPPPSHLILSRFWHNPSQRHAFIEALRHWGRRPFSTLFLVTKPSFVCLHWFQSVPKIYRDQIFWDKLECIGRQIWWYHWAVLGSCIWHLFFSAKHWWGRLQIKSAFFSSRPKFEFKWCWTFSLEMFRWYLRVTRNTTQLGFYEIVAILYENVKQYTKLTFSIMMKYSLV